MQQKSKILWVEDSARFELATLLGPIFASHEHDLTLAENASSACEYLRHRKFDAIIVDIRLPPGPNPYWRAIFKRHDSDRTNAKLGLELLRWLLGDDPDGKPKNGASTPGAPRWPVDPTRIGVFSVETKQEIGDQLEELGVMNIQEKQPGLPDTILLDIVTRVLTQASAPAPAAD